MLLVRAPHGADHAERLGRRARAGRRRDGLTLRLRAVAAADAARLRRPRRLAARAHRRRRSTSIVSEAAADAGRRADRVLRLRARRRAAARSGRSRSSCCSATGCCPSGRHASRRATSATSPGCSPSSTALDERRGRLLALADGRGGGRVPPRSGAHRRDGLPRDPHGRRHVRRRWRSSGRASSVAGETHARGGRHAPAARPVGRAGGAARRARRARRRRPERGAPPGRRRSGPARSGRSSCSRGWSCCSRRASCRRRSRGCSPPGRSSLSGVLTIDQAYRGIQWTTVILVGGMIPLSTAMTQTGAAAQLAERPRRRRRRRRPARPARSGSSCSPSCSAS